MKYLASPYTHPDPFIREERYIRTMKVLTKLLLDGEFVYSPIVHCHELSKIGALPKDSKFWLRYDLHMLSKCEELLVLRIEGWHTSVGIAEEVVEAQRLEIPVTYL